MVEFSRRSFLKSSAASSASLVVAFHVPRKMEQLLLAAAPKRPLPPPNAFLRIGADDSVTILLAHSEMGQGIWTALPMLVAEELGCAWSSIRVENAPAAPVYAHTGLGIQMTGGSSSTNSEFDRYRTVGAMAREMLVRAAAQKWRVSVGVLSVKDSKVMNGEKSLSFGALAGAAQALSPPTKVKLKPSSEWTIIGKPTRRLDTPEKITGKAQFGIDVQFPGLRTAIVARGPVFGAKVKSFDATKALAVPGVEKVVQVPSGVAVVASHFWAAKQGRAELQVQWDLGPGADLDTTQLLSSFRALAATPGMLVSGRGECEVALGAASKRLVAEFNVPYLAHAAMEPLNCTVKLDADGCDIWTGTQFQTVDQGAAARLTGLPPAKVRIHTTFLGGAFGRRATPTSDFVSEAVQVAMAARVPVKVVWTREDDTRGGYYRPMFVHRVEAGLDEKGSPVAWKHTIVGQSIVAGTPFESMMVKNGIDGTSVEGVAGSPYMAGVPAHKVMLHSPRTPIPVLWLRSVGNTHTAFVMESMVDELAHAAGEDPLAYRLRLLSANPRFQTLLRTVAEKAGWGQPPPAGRARGLSVHESFGSIVAQVAEVSVDDKRIRVHRVVCGLDCGVVVNPLSVEAQLQGAIAFSLGLVLHSELTIENGRVKQGNFNDYKVLRLNEMPVVEVYLAQSTAPMGGVGEPGAAPLSAAVANAVFALTGQRLRSLPLRLA